ncbi:MAG: hypothetical protein J2O46_11000 [Nocardioides sp.]|nr:hypothetical protein [Nocardioides sp.]
MSDARRPAPLLPGALTPEQRALYDEICSGPRAGASRPNGPVDSLGRLTGPFDAMLRSPAVGAPLQRLGAALRYASSVDDVTRELVILLVAGFHDSGYERAAHQRVARTLGVADGVLDAVDRGEVAAAVTAHPGAASALTLAHLLLHRDIRHDQGAEEVAELRDALGEAALFEVNTLVGYYSTLATQLALFSVEAP